MKQLRKSLLVVRTGYRMLSDDNRAPDLEDALTRKLGLFNDKLKAAMKQRSKSLRRELEDRLSEKADGLLALLKRPDALFDQDPAPPTRKSFLQDQEARLAWIESTASKSNPDRIKTKLTVRGYHDLRKRLRDFEALFKLMEANEFDVGRTLTLSLLSKISRRMGDVKDGLLALDHAKARSDDEPTSIDLVTARMINRFLTTMKASLQVLNGK